MLWRAIELVAVVKEEFGNTWIHVLTVVTQNCELGIHQGQSGSLWSAFVMPTRLERSVSLGTVMGCYYSHTSVSLIFIQCCWCLSTSIACLSWKVSFVNYVPKLPLN